MLKAAEAEVRGEVGWLKIKPVQDLMEESWETDEYTEVHLAIALGLQQFRHDPAVRVIVITGAQDGEFHVAPRSSRYVERQEHHDRLNPLTRETNTRARPAGPRYGAPPAVETLAMMEKPVVARVNGDAIGYGQSLLWGSDIIVAREDAVISDVHMGQGDVVDHRGEHRGFPWATPPGDGAMSYWPLFLPPTKAKEFMLLSRALTARELAAMNIVNYAVPLPELDTVVDRIVGELLARPDQALRATKRIANKTVIQQWNLAQDYAYATELLAFWEHGAAGHMQAGWTPAD